MLALLLFAAATPAQEKPDRPKPKADRAFWIGTAGLAAAKIFDAIETRKLLDRGGWENDPVYGLHPSPARQAGVNAAFFAGQVTLFYFTERSKRRWVRWTGRTFIGLTVASHVRFGACDASINTHSPQIQNCKPWTRGGLIE